jgi:hypothetical protein
MFWLIIIGIAVVIGYYWLKGVGEKSIADNIQRMDDRIDRGKEFLIKWHTDQYNEARRGENIILNIRGKNSVLDRMIETWTEVQLIHLWNKHVITVMASDKYSQQSKQNLYSAWYSWITKTSHAREHISYYEGDAYDELITKTIESRETLKATLEAFDYDTDQEEKDTAKEVSHRIKTEYKDVPLGKPATKPKTAGKVL